MNNFSPTIEEREYSSFERVTYGKMCDDILLLLGDNGELSRTCGEQAYEVRGQQIEMANKVADSLVRHCHLAIEAPTGIGKTFAYLVPAIYWARYKKQPVIVTTHTITLQEQILNKDLPLLSKLKKDKITYAIAKGRKNYLCRRRLSLLGTQQEEILPGFALSELDLIMRWSYATTTGDRSELDFEPSAIVWEQVCCDPWLCFKSKCQFRSRCFLLNARIRMMNSDIIIANHAIYFSDLQQRLAAEDKAARGRENSNKEKEAADFLLPDYSAVIFDEAHTIEDVAGDHMGISISSAMILRLLSRLYDAERGRGLLFDFDAARMAVVKASDYLKRYFSTLSQWLTSNGGQIRYTQAGYLADGVSPNLLTVERHLESIVKDMGAAGDEENFVMELQGIGKQLLDVRMNFYTFCEMQKSHFVYWLENRAISESVQNVVLNMVPMQLSEVLGKTIFGGEFTTVLTSATLATNRDMSYFLKRLGAVNCQSAILESDYDYKRQVTLYLTKSLPDPQSALFLTEIIPVIEKFILKTHGKAFVLFTSYKMMMDVAGMMQEFFDLNELTLMIQGGGIPKNQMLEKFKKDINSVIFGTSSFWTGVDIPGESLSNVIIVKLPFTVPDHPVVQARCDEIRLRGGNPFYEYTLPEAILQLRQGFGRLIRSKTDEGIVVILDRRITTARYGKQFLDSLPECSVEYF